MVPLNNAKHTVERYKLILAYDGSAFSGSQRQAKSRTVQSELESALARLGWQGKSVILAGRTDSGVHAKGQVATCDLVWPRSTDELQKSLNALLPVEIAVQSVEIVDELFHARFDATARRYEYRIFCKPVRDPLRERFFWRVWPALDEEKLHLAATRLIGEYDFSAFGSPPRPGSSTFRSVTVANWQKNEDEWIFNVQANAFLYRMVRRMTFIQVCVAQGKLSASEIAVALEKKPGVARLPAGLAPAHGLSLVEVIYPE